MLMEKPGHLDKRTWNRLIAEAIAYAIKHFVSSTAPAHHDKSITVHELYKRWAEEHSGGGTPSIMVDMFTDNLQKKYGRADVPKVEVENALNRYMSRVIGIKIAGNTIYSNSSDGIQIWSREYDEEAELMIFTKKHYDVLGSILRESMRDIVVTLPSEKQDDALKGLAIVVSKMANKLQEDNPRFKRDEFLSSLKPPTEPKP